MGLLIAMIGMVDVGLIVANDKTLVQLGDVMGDSTLMMCLCGVLLVSSLVYWDVKGAILIGIAALTLISWIIDQTWPQSVVQWPEFHQNDFLAPLVIFDLSNAAVFIPALASFVLICIFDISGVIFGLATLGGLISPEGEIKGSWWTFIASGVGTLVAAWYVLSIQPFVKCSRFLTQIRAIGANSFFCHFAI